MLSLSWAKLAALKTFSTPKPDLPRFDPRTQVILTRVRNNRPNYCDDCYRDPRSEYVEDDDFPRQEWKPRPKNLTNIPSLEALSYLKVAIALWYNLNVPVILLEDAPEFTDDSGTFERHSDFGCMLLEKVLASVEKLSVPESVSEEIVDQVTLVGRELQQWARYHYWKAFFNLKKIRFVYTLIYYVVWHPDGTIDEIRTAKNLLTSDDVSKIDKYYLSCLFCLKDEIEVLWKSLSKLNRDMVGLVEFSDHPLIFYWTCYCKNTFEKIPVPGHLSMDNFMFNLCGVDNWPAHEYFFERLSGDEQIENLIWFINKRDSKYQTLLLSKLDKFQRLQVFMDKAVEIMKTYASSPRDIIRTWNEIQTLVDRDQFVSIFHTLLAENVDWGVLQYIWTEDSDEFREHLLKSSDYETIVSALEKSINVDENNVLFILVLNAPASIKNSIKTERLFFEHCVKLMNRGRVSMLDKLLGVYFPTEEKLIRFKTYLREDFFNSYSQELIKEGKLNSLGRLLPSFIPSADECAQFKLNLTKEQFFREHCEKLINRIVNKFASPVELENLLDLFLVKPELVLEFKKDLVNNSNAIRHRCLNCFRYGSDKDVNDFIDGVFDEMLKGCIFSSYDPAHRLEECEFRSDFGFFFLDQFLEWCLESPEKIREYKLRRIDNHMKIDTIRMLLLKKKSDQYLRAIMRWFFKGNAADVEEFKNKNKGRKILMFV